MSAVRFSPLTVRLTRRIGTSPAGCSRISSYKPLMSGRPLGRLVDAGQDARDKGSYDVALVFRAAPVIGSRLRGPCREVGRVVDRVGAQRTADERMRRVRGIDRGAADAGQRDAGPGDR